MATAGKGGMEENYGGENEGEGEGEGEAEGEYGGDHQWTVTSMVASVPLWACWAGVFLLIGCASLVCFVYMRDDLVRAWHRRQAAQAAREAAQAAEEAQAAQTVQAERAAQATQAAQAAQAQAEELGRQLRAAQAELKTARETAATAAEPC
jgi:hypothetical protein